MGARHEKVPFRPGRIRATRRYDISGQNLLIILTRFLNDLTPRLPMGLPNPPGDGLVARIKQWSRSRPLAGQDRCGSLRGNRSIIQPTHLSKCLYAARIELFTRWVQSGWPRCFAPGHDEATRCGRWTTPHARPVSFPPRPHPSVTARSRRRRGSPLWNSSALPILCTHF
jgi:hypothetical protein